MLVLCTFAYVSFKNTPTTFSISVCPSTGNNSKYAKWILVRFSITSISNIS